MASAPVITAGSEHGIFLKTDGSLWAAGWNAYGQLGDGTTIGRNNEVNILASGVKVVDVGFYYSLFLKTDGSLWAWVQMHMANLEWVTPRFVIAPSRLLTVE